MTYVVHEIFFTLQGEGANTGRPAVFCRFAGCNLWSGRERDRAGARCPFCDTNFRGTGGPGGGRFATSVQLVERIWAEWPDPATAPFVVFTGGEPALQLDEPLLQALHRSGASCAIETNGTLPLPLGLDWTCVSPKVGEELAVTRGDELKLVFPQEGIDPAEYQHLAFTHFFLQPMDGADTSGAAQACISYCLAHPRWRLSLQIHKLLGIP
jgi:7-carboxy-7-deazaguanine synthase